MDIIDKIELLEEQLEITPGVKKYRTLKALNFMKENLKNENVKTVLKSLECDGCKNKEPKKIVETLIELVENTKPGTPEFYLVEGLFKSVKHLGI